MNNARRPFQSYEQGTLLVEQRQRGEQQNPGLARQPRRYDDEGRPARNQQNLESLNAEERGFPYRRPSRRV